MFEITCNTGSSKTCGKHKARIYQSVRTSKTLALRDEIHRS